MEVRVGIADMNVVKKPEKLITIGLGSCIGVALYDKTTSIGGLSHIMLPLSYQFSNISNPYKFADLAIPILISKMVAVGSRKYNITAKLAGGASMFNFTDKSLNLDIGDRNIKAVIEVLEKENINITAMDVGGSKGRTMILDSFDGSVQIKTVGAGIKVI
ncbi:chemotaxis protein CheD [Alloiococcus sp. CFN-8]|uniref:chemotaxis protein CheD n=1 Tax=Alloiococcus sp. CFN-8 TaxID=3416081 RepID=UPI003CED5449